MDQPISLKILRIILVMTRVYKKKVVMFLNYSLRFIIDEVLVLCTHIKKLSFLNIKSLKYNFKLIYLIINKNNKNTIGYTFFDKVKVT